MGESLVTVAESWVLLAQDLAPIGENWLIGLADVVWAAVFTGGAAAALSAILRRPEQQPTAVVTWLTISLATALMWLTVALANTIWGMPEWLAVLRAISAVVAVAAAFAAWQAGWLSVGVAAQEALKEALAQRHAAEEAVRQSEAQLESILETLPLHMISKDLDGRIQIVNQRVCELVGKSVEEIVGRTDFDLFPPELAAKYVADDRKVISTGQVLETVESHKKRDGTPIFVQVLKAPIFDADGKCVGTHAMFWDVTERMTTEHALKKVDGRYRRLVESSIIGVLIADFDGRVIDANDAFLRLVGYTRDEMSAGQLHWDQITPPEYRPLDERAIEQLLAGGTCTPYEKEYIRKDQSRVSVLIGVAMLEGSQEECICFVLDVSTRKRAVQELQFAKEQADAASLAKSQFLANMSHEVRTPMNAVIGLTELVLHGNLTRRQREYLELVLESAESLLGVINDVLDFSKVEAGKLELEAIPFGLRELLGDTTKGLAIRARGKPLELICNVAPDVPELVIGDPHRLRQVVVNLVGNSIKFTEVGAVTLSAELTEGPATAKTDDTPGVWLHLAVSDTGCGVPPDRQQAIFEPFEQADNSATRKHGGTGLGLAICQRLVRLMGGRIWLESSVGRGSAFHITLRLATDPARSAPPPPFPAAGIGARVLVVDDHEASRAWLASRLAQWGLRVEQAASSDEALALLTDETSSEPVRIALCEAELMEEEHQLAKQFGDPAREGGPALILMTSGCGADEIVPLERMESCSCLMKPLKESELRETIVAALGLSPEHDVPRPRRGMAVCRFDRALRILLAEDSPVNQIVAVGLLGEGGHEVLVAHNGRQAVEMATSENFDLVLMDVQMPEMDGLAAARAIRNREHGTGRHVPILAMTAHALKGDRERCLAAGMDDYLAKPIRSEELCEKISSLVKLEPQVAVLPKPVAPPQPIAPPSKAPPVKPPVEAPAVSAPGLARVNWKMALRSVGGKPRLLREVAEAFRTHSPELIKEMRAATAAGDAAVVSRLAHTLKGSAGYFGVEPMKHRAQDLESQAGIGNLGEAPRLLDELHADLEPVLLELDTFLDEQSVAK